MVPLQPPASPTWWWFIANFRQQRPWDRYLETLSRHGLNPRGGWWISPAALPTPAGTEFWPLAASVPLANRNLTPRHAGQSAQQHHRIPKLGGHRPQTPRAGMPASHLFWQRRPQISQVSEASALGQGVTTQRGQARQPQAPVIAQSQRAGDPARPPPKSLRRLLRLDQQVGRKALCSEIEPSRQGPQRSRLAGGDGVGSGRESRRCPWGSTSSLTTFWKSRSGTSGST